MVKTSSWVYTYLYLHIIQGCEHFFFDENAPSYLCIFVEHTKSYFTLKYDISLENLDNTTFEAKMSYFAKYDIQII